MNFTDVHTDIRFIPGDQAQHLHCPSLLARYRDAPARTWNDGQLTKQEPDKAKDKDGDTHARGYSATDVTRVQLHGAGYSA